MVRGVRVPGCALASRYHPPTAQLRTQIPLAIIYIFSIFSTTIAPMSTSCRNTFYRYRCRNVKEVGGPSGDPPVLLRHPARA